MCKEYDIDITYLFICLTKCLIVYCCTKIAYYKAVTVHIILRTAFDRLNVFHEFFHTEKWSPATSTKTERKHLSEVRNKIKRWVIVTTHLQVQGFFSSGFFFLRELSKRSTWYSVTLGNQFTKGEHAGFEQVSDSGAMAITKAEDCLNN